MWQDGLLVLGIVVMLIVLHWRLALVTMITLPILVYAGSQYGRRIRRLSRTVQERVANLSSILQESLLGIRIVEAFTMEEHEQGHLPRKTSEVLPLG